MFNNCCSSSLWICSTRNCWFNNEYIEKRILSKLLWCLWQYFRLYGSIAILVIGYVSHFITNKQTKRLISFHFFTLSYLSKYYHKIIVALVVAIGFLIVAVIFECFKRIFCWTNKLLFHSYIVPLIIFIFLFVHTQIHTQQTLLTLHLKSLLID